MHLINFFSEMNICQKCTNTLDMCQCIMPKMMILNPPKKKRKSVIVELRRKVLEKETTRYQRQEKGILNFSPSKIIFFLKINISNYNTFRRHIYK